MATQLKSGAVALALALSVLSGCARARDAGAGSKASAPTPGGANDAPLDRRRIVKKASLALEVAVPGDAIATATRVVEREGGFVANTQRSELASEGRRSSRAVTLTLRVPAERFTT